MEINLSSLILVFPKCGKLHLLELPAGMLTTKLTGNLKHLKGSMLGELLFQTRFSHKVGQSSFGEVQTEFRADTKKKTHFSLHCYNKSTLPNFSLLLSWFIVFILVFEF